MSETTDQYSELYSLLNEHKKLYDSCKKTQDERDQLLSNLDQTRTKLNQTRTKLDQNENRLREIEATEAAIRQTLLAQPGITDDTIRARLDELARPEKRKLVTRFELMDLD